MNSLNSKEHLTKDLEKVLSECKRLFDQDKLFLAYDLITKTQKSFKQMLEENKQEKETIQQAIEKFNHHVLVQRIIREYKEAQRIISEIESNSGFTSYWELITSRDDISTYFRHEENTPIYSLKLDAKIPTPIFNVASIFYEIDLYKKWVPYMEECKLLKRESKYRFLCYFNWNIPFPFQDRDMLAYGFGVDMLAESDSILVVIKSVDGKEFKDTKIPDTNGKYVRLQCHYAGFMLTALDENTTRVRIVSNCDPKLAYMPNWLLNLAIKHCAYYVMVHIRNAAKNVPNSVYAKRIEENKEIYGDIKRRIEERKVREQKRQSI